MVSLKGISVPALLTVASAQFIPSAPTPFAPFYPPAGSTATRRNPVASALSVTFNPWTLQFGRPGFQLHYDPANPNYDYSGGVLPDGAHEVLTPYAEHEMSATKTTSTSDIKNSHTLDVHAHGSYGPFKGSGSYKSTSTHEAMHEADSALFSLRIARRTAYVTMDIGNAVLSAELQQGLERCMCAYDKLDHCYDNSTVVKESIVSQPHGDELFKVVFQPTWPPAHTLNNTAQLHGCWEFHQLNACVNDVVNQHLYVVTAADTGGILTLNTVADDSKISSISTESQTIAASAGFGSIAGGDASSTSTSSDKETFAKAVRSSTIYVSGSAVTPQTADEAKAWEASLETDPALMGVHVLPVFDLITPERFPSFNVTTVLGVQSMAKAALDIVEKSNLGAGCTDTTSEHFDPTAILSTPCNDSYQSHLGGFVQTSSCADLNRAPGTCPPGYTLKVMGTTSVPEERSSEHCHRSWFHKHCSWSQWVEHCSVQLGVCVSPTMRGAPYALRFHGAFSATSKIPNPVTSTMACPANVDSTVLGGFLTVCHSPEDDSKKLNAVTIPFGGIFSCASTNPLANNTQGCPAGHKALNVGVQPGTSCEWFVCMRITLEYTPRVWSPLKSDAGEPYRPWKDGGVVTPFVKASYDEQVQARLQCATNGCASQQVLHGATHQQVLHGATEAPTDKIDLPMEVVPEDAASIEPLPTKSSSNQDTRTSLAAALAISAAVLGVAIGVGLVVRHYRLAGYQTLVGDP